MISPGFVTISGANAINSAAQKATEAVSRLDRAAQISDDHFPAKLTAYDSGTGAWSWTRQAFDADGDRYDHPSGQTGSPTFAPAYAIGYTHLDTPTFPVEVWLERRMLSGTDGPVYEFVWGGGGIPDCSLTVKGKINLVNQKLGAGCKVVSSLGLGTDYADLVEIATMGVSTFHGGYDHIAAQLFTPDASEILGYTTDGVGIGCESIYVKSTTDPGNRMWWHSVTSGSVDISGVLTAYTNYYLSPLVSTTPGAINSTLSQGGFNIYTPGLASPYAVGATHGTLTSAMDVIGMVTGTQGVQSLSYYYVNDQSNISGSGAGTMFKGGYTPAFTKWYGVTVAGGIVTTGDTTVATSALSGTVGVANGGTGTNTLASGQVMYGNGTSAVQTASNLTISSGEPVITYSGSSIRIRTASV